MLPIKFENIPDELTKYPQWVNWRLIEREGKATKPPYQPNGNNAKTDDAQTWSDFNAVKSAADKFAGVGFVLTQDDSFVALDFDKCRCPAFDEDKEISGGLNMVLPEIAEHIRALNSYTEISPSGKGIRIFLKGKMPINGKRKGPIEAYQSGRYVTVTGHVLDGFPLTIESRQEALDAFFQDVFGTAENSSEQKTNLHQGTSTVDWKVRLEKAFNSKKGDEIRKLYAGDYSAYPSQSEADLALCSHLAFWFDGDKVAIDAAFRESSLYRDKWDRPHHSDGRTYGHGTIDMAVQGCHAYSNDGLQKNIEKQIEESTAPPVAWPEPLHDAAYHGLAGEFVRKISPQTEADSAALLFQFLAAFGNIVGRNPYFMVEATKHYCNEFVLLVGNTSKGRKGTAWDHVRRIAETIDSAWASKCIKSGLTSGEGLIYHVRDPMERRGKIPADEGVLDKRLVAYESEFATILKIIERKDNTLSTTMRDAWDRGDLSTLAKNSPATATGAHISIVSHITKEELRARLSDTEAFNGFANRFLFVCVKRSKLLPEGGRSIDLSVIILKINEALAFSQTVGEMVRDEEARDIWFAVYAKLTRDQPGILGSVLARDAAHVVRLSMLYALLDCSKMIRREHLMAALACWEYAEASARFIFDSMTGDPIADRIYEAAWAAGADGITRTFISSTLFKRNISAGRTDLAIQVLSDMGKIEIAHFDTGGRRETRICVPQRKKY